MFLWPCKSFFVYVKLPCKSLYKRSLAFTSFGKNCFSANNCLSANSRVTFERWTPTRWLSCISNAALLNLKLLLYSGQNISFKKWLRDLFFNEDASISPMIFHSQPRVEHMLGEKNVVRNSFTFHETTIFLLNVRLYIFLK